MHDLADDISSSPISIKVGIRLRFLSKIDILFSIQALKAGVNILGTKMHYEGQNDIIL